MSGEHYPAGTNTFVTCVLQLDIRDNEAWAEFVRRFQQDIFAIVCKRLGDPELADEATQATLVRLFEKITQFDRSKGNFRPWLSTTAWRIAIDIARERKDGPQPTEDGILASLPDEQEAERLDRHVEWWAMLEMLERLRDKNPRGVGFFLDQLNGKSVADIAAEAKVPPTAVYRQLGRVREDLRAMRQRFEEEGPGPRVKVRVSDG